MAVWVKKGYHPQQEVLSLDLSEQVRLASSNSLQAKGQWGHMREGSSLYQEEWAVWYISKDFGLFLVPQVPQRFRVPQVQIRILAEEVQTHFIVMHKLSVWVHQVLTDGNLTRFRPFNATRCQRTSILIKRVLF